MMLAEGDAVKQMHWETLLLNDNPYLTNEAKPAARLFIGEWALRIIAETLHHWSDHPRNTETFANEHNLVEPLEGQEVACRIAAER
jgi:hypothetical protein